MTTSTTEFCCDASDLGWKVGFFASAVSLFGDAFRFVGYVFVDGEMTGAEYSTDDGGKYLFVAND